MLIGWHAANMSSMSYLVKNEMWASEVGFACLTWLLDCLLERLYRLQTHMPAAVDPQ